MNDFPESPEDRKLRGMRRDINELSTRLARVERRQVAFDVYREKAGQLVADLIDLTWRAVRGKEF